MTSATRHAGQNITVGIVIAHFCFFDTILLLLKHGWNLLWRVGFQDVGTTSGRTRNSDCECYRGIFAFSWSSTLYRNKNGCAATNRIIPTKAFKQISNADAACDIGVYEIILKLKSFSGNVFKGPDPRDNLCCQQSRKKLILSANYLPTPHVINIRLNIDTMSFQQGIPDLESSWAIDSNDVKIFKEIGHGM